MLAAPTLQRPAFTAAAGILMSRSGLERASAGDSSGLFAKMALLATAAVVKVYCAMRMRCDGADP